MAQHRRVAITGLGIIAPNGIGLEAFWQATSSGRSGITPLTDTHPLQTQHHWVAGIVKDFSAEAFLGRKLAQRTDRMTHLALAAIQEAISDAKLDLAEEDPRRVGAVIANTMGGVDYVLKQLAIMYSRGPRFVSAYTAIAWLNVANVGQTAIRYGIQGYCKTPVNDASGGLDAQGMAYRAIQRGAADVIIAGGCEAFIQPIVLQVLARQGVCYTSNDPQGYRPFDRQAAGMILAEGAGMCILEEYEHAQQRGATIYGEITGYSQTNDAHGLHGPSSDGTRYARAIRLAMQEGQTQPADIAYISLDGRAQRCSDQGEAAALRALFGDQLPKLPVSIPRTQFGHSYAAAGAIDTITALLSLKHSLIPPTINCDQPDPDYSDLDIVRTHPRKMDRTDGAVLLGARGIGGANSALVVRR